MKTMDKWEREYYEVSEYNRPMYTEDISDRDENYRTTIKDFTQWLRDTDSEDDFRTSIHDLNKGYGEYYGIAVRYTIPIVMIKHFMRTIA